MSIAESLFPNIRPPTVSGANKVVSDTTGAAANDFDWVTALGADAPKGKVMVTLEVVTQDCYVRFGPTLTTGTTASNGMIIKVGVPRSFYVDPVDHKYIDHLSPGGAGTLKLYVSSPMGERRYI